MAAPRRPLRFSKMHGAGNDFVVLDLRDGTAAADAGAVPRAGRSPYRRRLRPDPDDRAAAQRRAPWRATASGTPTARNAQQCGNGARCVAAWLVRDGARTASALRARQSRRARTRSSASADGRFRIAMGVPRFAPRDVPLRGLRRRAGCTTRSTSTATTVRFGAVSMGNPHALIEVDDVDDRAGGDARAGVAGACRVSRFGQCRLRAGRWRATASACACTSAASAKRWPAAAAPARRRRS